MTPRGWVGARVASKTLPQPHGVLAGGVGLLRFRLDQRHELGRMEARCEMMPMTVRVAAAAVPTWSVVPATPFATCPSDP